MTDEQEKGHISVQYTVWCGTCASWDQISGPKGFCTREWKEAGWRNTKAHGWQCPPCVSMHGKKT